MWFGTDDGLNKYDGYTFTIYKHDPENPLTLSDNSINVIFQDSHGTLWFGTNRGLDRFDPQNEVFHHYFNNPSDPLSINGLSVSAIVEDAEGSLWVGTGDGGLNRLSPLDNSFTHFQHYPDRLNSLVSDMVTALAVDPKGGLWVGTYEGLDFYDPGTNTFTHYQNDPQDSNSLRDNKILSLFFDHSGLLWIGTEEGGLHRFNQVTQSFTSYQNRPGNPYSLISNYVRTIHEDEKGRLWIGGRKGLHLMERSEDYFIRYQHDPNDPHSLSNDYILSMFEDHSGVLWIGTYGGGLSKYNQTNDQFNLYQHRPSVPNSLSNDLVNAILEDKDGNVWVGTMDGGLNRMDAESGSFTAYVHNPIDLASLSNNDVRALYVDRYGGFWVGTYGGGLNYFDQETGRFQRYVHEAQKPNSLSDDRVTAIYEDQRGNLWIGTVGGGLNLLDRTNWQFKHFRYDPNDASSLASDYVRAIYEDHQGKLWVGTNNGISVMDPDTHRFRTLQNNPKNLHSLSNNRVLCFYEEPDGIMWIGTLMGGLNRFDPATATFRHFNEKQGLPNDAVNGILADRNGDLWMSTNMGLARFDPVTETFRNYDVRDGLQSNEFNSGAYYQNTRGRMYFGGLQGFNAFTPEDVQDNLVPPPVVITAFKKFNQVERVDLSGNTKITLSYQDNFISFEFVALDYNNPDKNQYAYMLEGFDKNWIYAGNRRYASYTNLKGGDYIFRVKGANKDGIWNDTGTRLEIQVIPPVWERWWFIGSVGLILASAGMGGYWLRMKGLQAQHRYLEELVCERTQEIERRRQVAEGLREIMAIINSNRSLKECLDTITQQAVRLMDAQAVILFRCDQDHCPQIVASNQPMPGNGYSQNVSGIPEWVGQPLLEGHALLLSDMEAEQSLQPNMKAEIFQPYHALLAAPLFVNDQVDGGLLLLYREKKHFTEEDLQMTRSFANHSALAIANAHLRSQAEELAVSTERSRLARDLHDAVTQTLFATSLIAEVLPRLWERNPEIAKQKVAEIRELTRGALAEMRTLLMELRPKALEDVPLVDLLQQLCEAFTGRARVPVKQELAPAVDMPPNVKIGFYRIAQEALNNISKHARARQVVLCLRNDRGRIEMMIEDDGAGFDPQQVLPDHFGIGIMEERAQSIQARYQIESQKGMGTRICVYWEPEEDTRPN